MIKKITFGNPFNTESVIKNIPTEKDISFLPGKINDSAGFEWKLQLEHDDIVYGLGESDTRGVFGVLRVRVQ